MSVDAMRKVWEHSKASGSHLLMLLALADCENAETGATFPSVSTLAKKLRTTERNVRHLLKALRQSGELRIESGKGPRGTNLYHVYCMPTPEGAFTPEKPFTHEADFTPPLKLITGGGGSGLPLTPEAGFSRTIKEPQVNRKSNHKGAARSAVFTPADRELAEQIFKDVKTIAPSIRPNVGGWANDIRLMRERDGKSFEDIASMWVFAHADSFWRSNVLSPSTLRKQWTKLEARKNTGGGKQLVKHNGFGSQDYSQGVAADGSF